MSAIWTTLLGLGDKLAAHVLLSAAAIALGIAVALPLAVWASRSRTVARVALGFASLVQTIPALALLALFFPILLSLRAVFGEDLPTLGFLPALLALGAARRGGQGRSRDRGLRPLLGRVVRNGHPGRLTGPRMTAESQTAPVATPASDIVPAPAGVMTRGGMGTIIVAILILDQVTKLLVRTQITLNDSIEIVPGLLNLVHVRNTGAAFGFLNAVDLGYKQFLMTAIALVALLAIGLYAWRVGSHERLARAGLALILGGAVGNLIDRASAGYVVDFVDAYWRSYHFWAFNVADAAITVGACLLILDMFVATNDVSPPV